MLVATCHCGAVTVEVPRRPRMLTSCNCSICHRYGTLWAYYRDADVRLVAKRGSTEEYRRAGHPRRFIRCKTCGCVMQWKKVTIGPATYAGVNARNFDPAEIAKARISRLDGAKTWKYLD